VELEGMAERIISMRHQLYDALQERGVLLVLLSL
jgi:aspartate/tyrosine/aromatic aminotransferase